MLERRSFRFDKYQGRQTVRCEEPKAAGALPREDDNLMSQGDEMLDCEYATRAGKRERTES